MASWPAWERQDVCGEEIAGAREDPVGVALERTSLERLADELSSYQPHAAALDGIVIDLWRRANRVAAPRPN